MSFVKVNNYLYDLLYDSAKLKYIFSKTEKIDNVVIINKTDLCL